MKKKERGLFSRGLSLLLSLTMLLSVGAVTAFAEGESADAGVEESSASLAPGVYFAPIYYIGTGLGFNGLCNNRSQTFNSRAKIEITDDGKQYITIGVDNWSYYDAFVPMDQKYNDLFDSSYVPKETAIYRQINYSFPKKLLDYLVESGDNNAISFIEDNEGYDGKIETVSGGEIALKDVCFSYTEDREILHNVSINIPKNGFVGIVGESGSGKSTIASLIMGRNTIDNGSLTIDGKQMTTLSEQSLMNTVTYIGFGSVFFKGTVRENLLLADKNADDKRLWQVLDDCQLSDFLKAENGLDTVLLENAGNLSGGQKQRLALARAILHDSPVYIFDEATSNIDIESEEAILSQIHSLTKKKTVIMISHRLANVVDADKVYVMDGGKVAESGTHTELLKKNGTYARLWKTQSALESYGKEAV